MVVLRCGGCGAGQVSYDSCRSRHCPKCQSFLAWYDNIPLLSWIILRGKCRGCALPISVQYPLIEATVGAIWVWSVIAYGPTLTMLRVAIAATILLGIAVTDLQHYVIPDGFTVTGLRAGLSPSEMSAVGFKVLRGQYQVEPLQRVSVASVKNRPLVPVSR